MLRSLASTAALLLIVSATLASGAHAQVAVPPAGSAPGRVSGVVASAESGEPLAAVAITVRNARDSTIVSGGMTSVDGRFRIDGLVFGVYTVRVSYVGHTPQNIEGIELTQAKPAADLGMVKLAVAPVELDAIEAQAQRSPVVMEIDRTTYSAKDMPAATGGSTTDLLRQIAELEVDINGNVKLRGNQSAAIHLNGRPAPLRGEALTNFLSQMPADRVAKVEVMPNPSARHDPEGMGGIVNIIMKDNADLGLSGNVSANGSTRGSRGFTGRLAYQKGRLTFFGGGSVSFSDNRNDLLDERHNLLATPVTIMRQEGETVNDGTFNFFDLTSEFKLGKKSTVWLTAMRYGGGYSNDAAILYGLFDTQRALLDQYDRITDGRSDYSTSDYAIGFKYQFVPQRHELTVDLRRSGYGSGGATLVDKMEHEAVADPLLLERSITDMDSDNRNLTLRADYTRPWGQKGRIETGINLARREMDDNRLQDVYVGGIVLPETHYESLYDYNENYRSAYLTLGQSFGRLGVQVGVRAELAQTDFTLHSTGERFDNDYNSVFPNVILSVDAGKQQTIRLSYSKRIGRPSSSLLNPYTPSPDPLNRQIGNPYLLPSYTHSLSLDYTRNSSKGTLRIAPFYRRSVDGWESIKRVDENGVSTVTYENSRSSEMMGSSITASIRPVGRISGSLSGTFYRQVTDATNISAEYSRDGFSWSLGGNLAARVTATLNAQLFGSYMPGREIPQGRMSGYMFNSLGLRQQLLGNKATLSLSLNDPFNLYHYSFETRDRSHIQTSRTTTKSRSASLSLTWNFGKPPQQNSRRNGPESSDESVRIR